MDVIRSSVIGTLKWDERLECWKGRVNVGNFRQVDISLFEGDLQSLEQTLARAEDFVRDWAQWWIRIRTELVGEIRELYNCGGWRADDDPVLDESAFLAALHFHAIHVSDTNEVDVCFRPDDEEMFLGHLVQIVIDMQGEVVAKLAG
jgi:hypothetical protein